MMHSLVANTPAALAPVILGAPSSEMALQRILAAAGWTLDYFEVGLTHETTTVNPVIVLRCHRHDGLWIWAKVDALGRGTLESFFRERWLGMPVNAKGNWAQSPQIDDLFFRRQKFADGRQLIAGVASYLSSNTLNQPLSNDAVQTALVALCTPELMHSVT